MFSKKAALVGLSLLTLSLSSFAKEGGDWGAGNGGDICESEIKTIREDIRSWIFRGGHEELDFKGKLTSKNYKEKMIQATMPKVRIECTKERKILG